MNRQSSAQSSKRIELVSDGKAVAFNPALLTRVQAAIYCAFSVGLLDKLRASDAARRMRGEPISGPAWVTSLQNALLVGMLSRVSVLRARSDRPGWGETRNCRSRTHADDHLDTLPATGIVVPWQSLLTRADPPVKNSLRGPFRAYVREPPFPVDEGSGGKRGRSGPWDPIASLSAANDRGLSKQSRDGRSPAK
jgi:hypothetical protein